MLQEYCIDFVRTSTCEPVSTPPGFEVWLASSPVGPPRELRLRTLEFGMSNKDPDDIPLVSKTFVVQGGQTCVLNGEGTRIYAS